MFIPNLDVVAAALQTQAAYLAPVRWSHIGNDTTHYKVLDGLAVWARHGRNLLTEESATLVHLGLIAALPAAIFQFPRHLQKPFISQILLKSLAKVRKNVFFSYFCSKYLDI